MARLVIYRAEPFVRGDESIRIKVDGKDIGMLPAHEPLVAEVAAGPRKLRATMNGMRGRKLELDLIEDELVELRLSETKIQPPPWWERLWFIPFCALPNAALTGKWTWVIPSVFVLFLLIFIYRWRRRTSHFLQLELLSQPSLQPAV